jgi:hypothetical protein
MLSRGMNSGDQLFIQSTFNKFLGLSADVPNLRQRLA